VIFDWDPEKNEKLKRERGISFEEIALLLGAGSVWAITRHWNTEKYPNQRIFLIPIDGRIIAVPFVQNKDLFFSRPRSPQEK
jgi:uncharacterized DUF497 family protein